MADKKHERRGLGRGLSALMADVQADERSEGAVPAAADRKIPIEKLVPNPDQPRRSFADENLQELAASIREKGVIQPLIVRENPNNTDTYQIVAGERRWRAAQVAQLHELPVVVRDFSDTEVLEIAIIENIQRADLNPVEEAMGYRQLMDRFGHTQEKLAQGLSKSRSHIANLMRLLQLPEPVLDMLRSGDLTTGHARALITTEDPLKLAKEIVAKGLSVRETERLAQAPKIKPTATKPQRAEKDADTRALEADLSANLGMKVNVDHKPGQDSGQVLIKYKTLEDLDELCRILTAMPLDESR
ncbi:ParB/RepB/Spo0J family partition protein [Pseudohalocynthiibacter sp. F2068]|jgi:ParB family transcriptional regulator, chromosome partitioning protein|uniref:ParB/RepB/Spo0J family partition protein n=1 Tax=Pseudohalocynthiibacter sp. F2068 TaxID=2926418 RepID=UPI001FF6C2C1|nr:ParB/RepB/Spo0J family partition protein [Pseudohalocynthiibacter sp. F2068]MCK0102851.1 ParB/RepB/Spo0J family partition protein [Pseudohalocynthiibacter sp. F2068]